jgi:hypothetical protein
MSLSVIAVENCVQPAFFCNNASFPQLRMTFAVLLRLVEQLRQAVSSEFSALLPQILPSPVLCAERCRCTPLGISSCSSGYSSFFSFVVKQFRRRVRGRQKPSCWAVLFVQLRKLISSRPRCFQPLSTWTVMQAVNCVDAHILLFFRPRATLSFECEITQQRRVVMLLAHRCGHACLVPQVLGRCRQQVFWLVSSLSGNAFFQLWNDFPSSHLALALVSLGCRRCVFQQQLV